MSQKSRKKILNKLSLKIWKKETGFNTLLTFLDIHLAKDNLPDSLKKFEEFEDLNKLFVFKRLFIPFDFHLYGEVTIASERLHILTQARRHSRPLSSDVFLACHPTVIPGIRL